MKSLPGRVSRLASIGLLALLLAQPAPAHHGWAWAADEESEISGRIIAARLGNPHGELQLSVAGESWRVEVGQPWRNRRAGLDDSLLAPGRDITVHGHRSARAGERLLKAERVIIDGVSYNLYPDRDS